jgi:hypothetical protein
MKNNKIEPKTSFAKKAPSTFRVGIDRFGCWVALEDDGRCGGLFVGRNEAIRFALSQNGNRPEHVLFVESSLDLDFATTRSRSPQTSTEPADVGVLATYGES